MTEDGPSSVWDKPANRRDAETGAQPKGASYARGTGVRASPKSIEDLVREALSQHLIRSPYLPPSLARTLSADVATASLSRDAVGPNGSARLEGSDPVGGVTLPALRVQIRDASDALRDLLIQRHDLPAALVDELIMHGQERALTKLMAIGFPREEIEALAGELSREQSLTPTLLLRSLCLGELMFFESAMAALAATSVDRVHALIYDDGPHGFSQLYELASLPLGLFRAFRASMEVILQLGLESARHWRSDFTDEIISRLVKEYEQVCPEDLEHVLSQLSHRLEETPPVAESSYHAPA